MSAIICKNCGTENDPGRIYCVDCSEKLDAGNLSDLVGKGDALTKTTIQKKIKASQKKDRPRSGAQTINNIFSALIKLVLLVILVVILGAIGYSGFLIYQVPEGIPKWKSYADYGKWEVDEQVSFEESFDRANIQKLDLEDALLNRISLTAQWNQKDANAWLARNLAEKLVKFGPIDGRFIGGYIQFLPDGKLNVITRYRIFNQNVYFQYRMRPSLENGILYNEWRGGSINSLPLHAELMKRLEAPLEPLQTLMNKNKSRLISCDSLVIDDNVAIISTIEKSIPDIDPLAPPPLPSEEQPATSQP